MAVRKVIQIGHPALKNKNKKIINLKSEKVKQLIKDLKDTMNKEKLIGIAAPQIAENYKIFVTNPRKTKFRKLGKVDQLRVYINPQITYFSSAKNLIYEGCGCVPNIFAPVIRPQEIEIIAFDEKGSKFSLRCDGILARVIQHEYDHLFGIEFLEKISDFKKIIYRDYYIKNIRNSKEQRQASRVTKIITFSA